MPPTRTTHHTTCAGERLELTLTAAEEVFLAKAVILAEDPEVSLGELVDYLYSDSNPALAASPIPGRGWVTAEVRARPLYDAFTDLFYRKNVARNPEAKESTELYTVSTAQAAGMLGISANAVRQAMADGRLASERVGGRLFTTHAAVGSYQVSRRGPRSEQRIRRSEAEPLRLVWGYHGPASLRFRVLDGDEEAREEHKQTSATSKVRMGALEGWRRVMVQTSLKLDGERRMKLWELVPETDPEAPEERVSLSPFEVVGRFRVVEAVEGREAVERWKAGARPQTS